MIERSRLPSSTATASTLRRSESSTPRSRAGLSWCCRTTTDAQSRCRLRRNASGSRWASRGSSSSLMRPDSVSWRDHRTTSSTEISPHELLGRFSAWQEVYSIDEAFLGLTGTLGELGDTGRSMKAAVARNVGLPVCVGIAPTKTLAKMANKWAKKVPSFGGVCVWEQVPADDRQALMRRLPVTEIWGVAGRLGARLAGLGIYTVADLAEADPAIMRRRFSVVLERTIRELNGVPCIAFETPKEGKDQLIFSRSFSKKITEVNEIRQVLSIYAQQAAARLARHRQQAKQLLAFAGTSHFVAAADRHHPSVSVPLPVPTADPVDLTKAALRILPEIRPGARYARAGVIVTDLSPAGVQPTLPGFTSEMEGKQIAAIIDEVTTKLGRDNLGLGFGGLKSGVDWQMARNMLSPRCTTHWSELAIVRA